MAKILGLDLPNELEVLYNKIFGINAPAGDGKLMLKRVVSSRRQDKENFMREAFRYFKTDKPFDNIAGQRSSYEVAGHPQGLTNLQSWVSQVGSAVNNGLDRKTEVLTGKRFGRFLKFVCVDGGNYGIVQNHPNNYKTTQKFGGSRSRREIIEVTEPYFGTFTFSFSYKFAEGTDFTFYDSPLVAIQFSGSKNLIPPFSDNRYTLIQDYEWHNFSQTFNFAPNSIKSYRVWFATLKPTWLALDSFCMLHNGINWARDRNCGDVLFSATGLFAECLNHWQRFEPGWTVGSIEQGQIGDVGFE